MHPIDPIGPYTHVLLCFVPFGTVWLPYKTGAKRAELVQKFVPRSRVRIFRNERTRWYETHQNMSLGSNGMDKVLSLRNVRATKSRQNFSQRTHLIQPLGP